MGDSSHSHSHAHQEEQCCNDHAPQPRESIFRLEAMDSVFDKACAAAGAGDLNQLKQYLLSNAISIDEVDGNGNTLLHFAATLNRTEVCDFLLQLCPSLLSVRNRENGHTPVHWAASSGAIGSLHLFSKYNNTCLFELDNSGMTCLHIASQNDQLENIHYLVLKGISLIASDVEGNTPLHWAVIKASEQAIRYLINAGADITATNKRGLTPLHYAAGLSHMIVIKHLSTLAPKQNRKFTAIAQIRDLQDRSPRDVAVQKDFMPAAKLMDSLHEREANEKTLSTFLPMLHSKRNQAIFWFFLPILVPLLVWRILDYPVFVGVALLLLAGAATLVSRASPHNPLERGPIIAGLYHLTCIVALSALYNGKPESWEGHTIVLLGTCMGFVIMAAQLIAMFSDPNGHAPIDPQEDCENWLAELNEGRVARICPTCRTRRALRTKHCKEDDICVSRFDHWCVWTYNSVGAGNHRAFLLMVALVVLGLVMDIGIFGTILYSELSESGWAFLTVVSSYPLMVISTLMSLIHLPWTIFLLMSQLRLVLQNLTTNEMAHGMRAYGHFKEGNPFDKGSAWSNLRDFLQGNSYKSLFHVEPKGGLGYVTVDSHAGEEKEPVQDSRPKIA